MTSPFNIKKVNLFSSWVYNVPKNEECTICRCNLNVQSLYNQEKCIDSFVVTGKCGKYTGLFLKFSKASF